MLVDCARATAIVVVFVVDEQPRNPSQREREG